VLKTLTTLAIALRTTTVIDEIGIAETLEIPEIPEIIGIRGIEETLTRQIAEIQWITEMVLGIAIVLTHGVFLRLSRVHLFRILVEDEGPLPIFSGVFVP
jgi:hypothetical protein